MSTVKADNFTWKTGEATAQVGSSVTGPQIVYGVAKSWCNYNGVTPGVRASFNISSVTKDGTGRYTPFFTNTLSDANYSIQMTVAGTGSYSDWSKSHWYTQSTITSSYFQTQNVDEGDSYYDTNVSLAVFR